MIARLKGVIEVIETDSLIIDVNGVGYAVFASSRTLDGLRAGAPASLWIETHVREDHIHLYGFAGVEERDWFKLLTTVQGVGAKVGLALLAALPGDQMLRAVAAGDKAAVCRAQGVGPKLAARIISELKDKVGGLTPGGAAAVKIVDAPPPGARARPAPAGDEDAGALIRDAASALANLGYMPSDALGAVSRAARTEEGEVTLDGLIRAGLAALAPRG